MPAKQTEERNSRRSKPPRVQSACPHDCPSTCALEVERIDPHTIGRVYGAKDNSYTQGVICAKVARYAERIHHPDRLLQPLRRVGPKGVGIDAFEPVEWEVALDLVADRFRDIMQRDGAQALWPYHYAGTMGLIQRDGIERFRRALGTSLQHSTFCTPLADAGWRVGTGSKRGSDSRLMSECDLIVMWGGNPVSTQVNVMHHVAQARREQGARFIVVDPYRTGTAEKADQHLMLRPGTDGALACAVMHVLLEQGLADIEYLEQHTDFDARMREHLATRTPAWAAAITGLEAAEIEAFATAYGTADNAFLRCGYGFSRSRNGAVNMHAVTCLPAIIGAWKQPSGGALYSNGEIYKLDTGLIQAPDLQRENQRVLDQSRIGAVLADNPADLQGGPRIMGMLMQNTNPLVVAPDTLLVQQGLQRDDLFLCVHEQFMTETAAMADVVLPATMFLEHDDLYQAGGHTHLQVTRKVVEPAGECRSNHQVLSALHQRLGIEHPADSLSEREIIEAVLQASDLPSEAEAYEQRWIDCAPGFKAMNFLDGFETPDRRFHFHPDWSRVGPHAAGMPSMPDHWDVIDAADDEHPFRLVAAPARQFLNTSFTETPTSCRMEGGPELRLHPHDAQSLGIATGDRVAVGNAQASIELVARVFDGLLPGTVVCESIWPNSAFPGGVGINALTSAQAGQPNGGAVFHDTAVWIRHCEQ